MAADRRNICPTTRQHCEGLDFFHGLRDKAEARARDEESDEISRMAAARVFNRFDQTEAALRGVTPEERGCVGTLCGALALSTINYRESILNNAYSGVDASVPMATELQILLED